MFSEERGMNSSRITKQSTRNFPRPKNEITAKFKKGKK